MDIKEALKLVNPNHIGLLNASLRSPSAHNAQPWKIKPLPGGTAYELHYDHNDYLPDDPDDRDAYLTMGAFTETLVLEAPNFGFTVDVIPKLSRTGDDLFVAEVAIKPIPQGAPIDPLSKWVSKRNTNRNHYQKTELTPQLIADLEKDLQQQIAGERKQNDEFSSLENFMRRISVSVDQFEFISVFFVSL